MNSLFTTAQYTEDQKNSQAILYAHVAHRSINVTCFVTSVGITTRRLLSSKPMSSLFTSLLKGNAVAAGVGVAIGTIATAGRMQGKEEIEWKDRAWRLLNNRKQNSIDVYSFGGMIGGGIVGQLNPSVGLLTRTVGGMGLGSIVGAGAFAIISRFAS